MSEELHIALIQTALEWENPEKNRTNLSVKIDEINSPVDLIVLPEMFTSGFTMNPKSMPTLEADKTIQWMQQEAKKRDAAITGSIVFHENGHFYNRLLFVTAAGILATYDKRHTFTLAGENKVYRAGQKRVVVDYEGFRICPLICYDLRFPVWSRNTTDYDLLVYVANWPKLRIMAWDVLLRARAIENMAYCVGVNRVGNDANGIEYPGHSVVYDSLGKSLKFSTKETTLCATLTKQHLVSTRDKFNFLADRDDFNLKY